eukprot:567233-Amphidinium_carterae.4
MQKISDPPGTRRNAQGRLVDEKTGKYTKNPTKLLHRLQDARVESDRHPHQLRVMKDQDP